ncbi:transcriptional regulator, MarR family [Singulisphaera sp. GP187]|uniref:MarR family winged helix-turn-helix transcriptional regulator n=1 Tax=Singulisphaera sp. GP187 TaxID=1882752 RepID=UPI00092B42D2|nr:MarR family transcriptional regulator [Singulisphaera sp. GP187]SIN87874.1 transcriptional regulator, MarR family [Singulisphaera sp. GP187]
MTKRTQDGEAFSDLVLEVFRLNGLLLAAGDQLAEPAALTAARWQVLGVADHGPAPVANVARIMGLTRQAVQSTSDALERDGFVEYSNNPHHRRAKLIVLTDKGRAALRQVEARQVEWADRLGAVIGLQTLKAAAEGLKRARQSLEADATPDTRKTRK